MTKNNQHRQSKFDFLVIGAGRGGTSLLAGLLDAHQDLELGFEKYSYDFLMAKNMTGQETHLENRIYQFLHHSDELARKSKKIWGNKITSEQVCALNETGIEDWLNVFVEKAIEGKRLIYILRDGRTCVTSKMQRTGQSFEEALKRWKSSIKLWKDLQQKLGESVYTVKFEDLVKNPEVQLQQICTFLDIDYETQMLKGTSNSKMRKEYQKRGFDLKPIQIEPKMKLWNEAMMPELNQAGYEL